nr:serine/threonine-protein kinase [Streptomyces sp. SID5789]
MGHGSYADVYRATHRVSKDIVALKRAHLRQEAKDRIRREIQDQRKLAHPNIMPILDHDPGYHWYAMPLALGSLHHLRAHLDDEDLASIIHDLASALNVAHQQGLIHRDISPHNILALPGKGPESYHWVVADWGMVRRPPGEASRQLTRTGQGIGTPGFDAPELSVDPRKATPAVDVYSLGRVAAWFLTKEMPLSGVPLLPDGDMMHWRHFVNTTTQQDVHHRVQAMSELRSRVPDVLVARNEPVLDRAGRLLEGLVAGNEENLDALVSLADAHQDNADLYFKNLAFVPTGKIRTWVTSAPERAARIASVMARLVMESPWGDRDRRYVGTPLAFVHTVLRTLIEMGRLGPAQDVAADFFMADAQWSFDDQRRRTLEWLADLDEAGGQTVAPVLAARRDVIEYYREPAWRARSVVLNTILGAA